MYTTEKFDPASFTPARFEADGEIELRGRRIPYHTVSEDNVFYDKTGKPLATIFSYSYFRSDVQNPADRPVIFAFNGGPGSSSMHVHAGMFGPVRLAYAETDRATSLPPYAYKDNPDCLLDVADLVMVDPVGTGYGVLLDESSEDKFFGIEEDAEAFLHFVEKWLDRYGRWLSPKYIAGESYGCTRAATALGIAATQSRTRTFGVNFDGVVMIGNTVTTGKYFGVEMPVEPAVLAFPTYAAIHWYHNHPTEETVDAFVARAKQFADTVYLDALYKGRRLRGEERQAVIAQIMAFTGVSRQYLEDRALRIDDESFRREVIRDQDAVVSRYDGRMTRPRYQPEVDEPAFGQWDDASTDRYNSFFYGVLTGAIFPKLNIHLERPYVPSLCMYDPFQKKFKWNREAPMGTTAQQLRNAMVRTHGLRVFFANGYYDTATHIGIIYYMLDHAGLPLDRVCVKGYPSGHMIYIGEDNVRSLSDDVRAFLAGGMPCNENEG